MDEGKRSKHWLDRHLRCIQPSLMRLPAALVFFTLLGPAARAQAPANAALWDLPATTLAVPPALETGATASFWNPAAALADGLRFGAQAVQTPDMIGLSGVIAGITRALGPRLGVGLIFGRVEIGDLVRTSNSPPSCLRWSRKPAKPISPTILLGLLSSIPRASSRP